MSRRGHKTGIITSYLHTWLLKTDRAGCVWVSAPIAYDAEGSTTKASVTEVRCCGVQVLAGLAGRLQCGPGLSNWSIGDDR